MADTNEQTAAATAAPAANGEPEMPHPVKKG
jgi:hypothetical protein